MLNIVMGLFIATLSLLLLALALLMIGGIVMIVASFFEGMRNIE